MEIERRGLRRSFLEGKFILREERFSIYYLLSSSTRLHFCLSPCSRMRVKDGRGYVTIFIVLLPFYGVLYLLLAEKWLPSFVSFCALHSLAPRGLRSLYHKHEWMAQNLRIKEKMLGNSHVWEIVSFRRIIFKK